MTVNGITIVSYHNSTNRLTIIVLVMPFCTCGVCRVNVNIVSPWYGVPQLRISLEMTSLFNDFISIIANEFRKCQSSRYVLEWECVPLSISSVLSVTFQYWCHTSTNPSVNTKMSPKCAYIRSILSKLKFSHALVTVVWSAKYIMIHFSFRKSKSIQIYATFWTFQNAFNGVLYLTLWESFSYEAGYSPRTIDSHVAIFHYIYSINTEPGAMIISRN